MLLHWEAELKRNAWMVLFSAALLAGLSAHPAGAVEKVYIDLTIEHQTMDGTAGNIYSEALTYHEDVMNLIKNDLNLTHVQVRAWLVDGYGENGWEPQNDNGDPNVIDWGGFQDAGDVHTDFLMMQELYQAGIQPTLGVFDVPDWMVVNPDSTTYRIIHEDMYPEFAEFIVSFLLHAKSQYGVDINFLEIQNEPNIGWRVYYSPEELADISEVLLDALDANGLGHVELYIGNVNKPSAAISYWEPSLKNPAVAARTAAAAYHAWEDMTKGVVEQLKVFCKGYGVQCWATEVGHGALSSHTWDYGKGSMRKHHQVLTWSNSSMAFQWTLAGANGSISPGGDPYPVYHLIKHYYQHIKPGSVRVDTFDGSGTLTTAFVNKADKTLSIVTLNENYARNGRFIITAPGVEFSDFTVYKTEENGILYQEVGTVPVSNGVFDYHLDPNAYYTFVAGYTKMMGKALPCDGMAGLIPSKPKVKPLPVWQAHVTCLAAEMQWGPTGDWMPARLNYQLGSAGQVLPAFDDFDLYITAADRIILGPDYWNPPEPIFWGATAYPSFLENPPVYEEQVPSDDEIHALILKNGDDYYAEALAKGILPPYGSQLDIPTILDFYLDTQGIVQLPLNEVLILFELGDDSSPAQEAFDFQDLVLNVRTEYEPVSEVVAENQIGPGGAYADGLAGQTAFYVSVGSEFSLPASVFTAPKDGTVNTFSVIAYAFDRATGNACDPSFWSDAEYKVHFWPSESAYFADPDEGDYHTTFSLPTNPDYLTVVGYYTSPQDLHTQHRILFDVSLLDWPVAAGQKFVIGVNAFHTSCDAAVSFSTGQGFGPEIDVLAYDLGGGMSGGPDYLPNLGLSHNQWATKVTIKSD